MDTRPTAPAPPPCKCCRGRYGRLIGFKLLDLQMKVTLCSYCDTGTDPQVQGPPILLQAIREGWG